MYATPRSCRLDLYLSCCTAVPDRVPKYDLLAVVLSLSLPLPAYGHTVRANLGGIGPL